MAFRVNDVFVDEGGRDRGWVIPVCVRAPARDTTRAAGLCRRVQTLGSQAFCARWWQSRVLVDATARASITFSR